MGKWLLIASGVLVAGAVIGIFIGKACESARVGALAEALIRSAPRPAAGTVDFASLSELPPPVARYFRHVLTDGQELIRRATIRQSGVLRTSTTAARWTSFTARQLVVPPATGFIWNARVETPLATHVRVLDSFIAGAGSGRVSLLSAFAVAAESGAPELNSGALHRYLAEAVWFPTALLPQSGVVWTPIDERTALATLTEGGTAVSLEFRFDEAGEVTGIYSPGRFGHFDGGYRQVPWEGHFRDYRERADMRVPFHGEVGWYAEGELQVVWKGEIDDVQYELGP